MDIEKKIVEVMACERWVGLVLWCQHAFGLRKTEALMLQPLKDIEPVPSVTLGVPDKKGRPVKVEMTKLHWKAWHGGVNVNITRGTKGKRPRVLHINEENDDAKETAYVIRQEVLDYGDRDTLGPPWFTLKQNARTYERVLARFGITHKDLGITGHGLRAGFACDMLQSFGITTTVRGGDGQHPDLVTQRISYKSTTEALGHGRISVIGAYAECITPKAAARQRKAKAAPGEPCGRA